MLAVGDSPVIDVQGPLERGDGGGHVPYLRLSQLLLRAEKRFACQEDSQAGLEEFNSFLVSDLILLVRSRRIEILHSLATRELFQATGVSELPAKRPEARVCLLGGAGHCPALSSLIFSIRNTDWKT